MGLLDNLRAAATKLDPSLQPTSNETAPLLGALIAYQEHGDKFLKAADDDDGPNKVSELLAGKQDKDADDDAGDDADKDDKATFKAEGTVESGKKDKK